MLFDSIRACTACPLRAKCNGTVPGDGDYQSRIMFIGEAPGYNEDKKGKPFIGQAGRVLDWLLEQAYIPRNRVFITNLVKCRPPNNNTPSEAEVQACAPRWLETEIALVQPEIIVAMGGPASRYIIKDPHFSIEKYHGIPRQMKIQGRDTIVLPVYHPAAGLHEGKILRFVQEDFQTLKQLAVFNVPWQQLVPPDRYPERKYELLESPESVIELLNSPQVSLDTETTKKSPSATTELWSVQLSTKVGEGFFVPRTVWDRVPKIPDTTQVNVHNYLYDAKFVRFKKFVDTMVMAYLLGLPQGLKDLGYRLCGIEMDDYEGMVRPYRRAKAMDYLQRASTMEWARTEAYEIQEWSKKEHKPVYRMKKPKAIIHKINERIKKTELDPTYDPYVEWYGIDARERQQVESVLGEMPDGTIDDAPFEEAFWYSCQDADVTTRVYEELLPRIQDMGLEQVLYDIDLPSLPLALNMMDNGMALDPEHFEYVSKKCFQGMVDNAAKVAALCGEKINPNSDQQVAKVVYGKLGFPPSRYTPTGRESTLDKELKKVNHPVIEPILAYRHHLKIKSTYADTLPRFAYEREGRGGLRVNSTIRTTRTETGRWAMGDPFNATNIPTRSSLGKEIRNGFKAPEGRVLIACDYCLAQGTLVETPYGHKTIESLLPGELVYSYGNGKPNVTRVKAKLFMGYQECIEVELDNGAKFIATPNHKVPVIQNQSSWGKLRVDELQVGDRLLPFRRSYAGNSRVTLYSHSNRNYEYEHRAIAKAVYGECPEGYEVDHINGYKSDNRPENLQYLPISEHRSKDGKRSYRFQDHTLRLQNLREGVANRRTYEGEDNPNYGNRKGNSQLCLYCNNEFYKAPTRQAKYCGQECYNLARKNGLNHKVTAVRWVGKLPTWDIEVEDDSHIFALACGVYTSNSQIEMRVMAHEAGCDPMIKIFREGRDIHNETAALILGCDVDDPRIEEFRRPVKNLGFGTMYGMTPEGLLDYLIKEGVQGWDLARCREFNKDYFKVYWQIAEWQMRIKAFARQNGYVKDMFGRIRYIPEIACPIRGVQAEGERMAINMPVQAGAQGIMKLAGNELYRQQQADPRLAHIFWLVQIHDDIMQESDADKWLETARWQKRVMEGVVTLKVPVLAEVKMGVAWGKMVELKGLS